MLVSRRDFLRACQRYAPVLGLSALELGRVESLLANPNGPTVLWLEGSSCSGCSVSFLNYFSTSPPQTAAEVLISTVNLAFHKTVMGASGQLAVDVVNAAYKKRGYYLIVEGGVAAAFGGHACVAWTDNGVDVAFLDVDLVAGYYPDYYHVGRGYEDLLAFGVFDLDDAGGVKLLRRGRLPKGSNVAEPVDTNVITERVTASWYAPQTDNHNPAAGDTVAVYPKNGAYSWLKAPRYNQAPYEAGPLARMRVSNYYQGGVSVLDRHRARALEALRIADAMGEWVGQLVPQQSVYTPYRTPVNATSIGLTEAPRGALGHWVKIANSATAKYQIITPTCWNASPRDPLNQRGPIEQALIGAPVGDSNQPVEVVRVIHSFDPCLSCAVHVMRPAEGARVFVLGHVHTDEEAACHTHPH